MVEVGDKVVSLDVFDTMFSCDYLKCKGICCVEGDSGAPLLKDEVQELEAYLPDIEHLLSPRARKVIAEQGVSYIDEEGDMVTSIVDGQDCVFTMYNEIGGCQCAYEKVFFEGKIPFRKPLSCQLYPIRLSYYKDFTAVNYHKWNVCSCALKKGKREGVAVYQFLEDALVRAFGQEWYDELKEVAQALKDYEKC